MYWSSESMENKFKRKNELFKPKWDRHANWHSWFAWIPVRVTPQKKAWLTFVERRLSQQDRNWGPNYTAWCIRRYEYRESQQISV